MDPNPSNAYNVNSQFNQIPPMSYNLMKKRDAKEFDKDPENFHINKAQPLGSSFSKPRTTRWQNPISIQEIQLFNQKYNEFIKAAVRFHASQIDYQSDANAMPTVSSTSNNDISSNVTSNGPKRVYEMLGQSKPNMVSQNAAYVQAKPAITSTNNYFSNLSFNSLTSKPNVESAVNTVEDYSKRAFKK